MTVPQEFNDLSPKYTLKSYSLANQVLGLEKVTQGNESSVEFIKKTLLNLLRYNSAYTVDDILGEEQ